MKNLVLGCAFIVTALPVHATTIHVPGDQPTIQSGIDAAAVGDDVLIAPGIYSGAGNRDIDFRGKAITVHSEVGAPGTIIDCGGSNDEPHRGFIFRTWEGPGSVLRGVTITNGVHVFGGAISCNTVSINAVIEDCVFSNNRAEFGGAIYSSNYSNLQLRKCTFADNTADGTISSTIEGGDGGGIWCYLGSPRLDDCQFIRNVAVAPPTTTSRGGGMLCGMAPILNRCIFTENRADTGGGLILLGSSLPRITDCEFTGNSAGNGGGMHLNGEASVISHCLFSGNTAKTWGGGASVSYGTPEFIDCMFLDNVVTGFEGFGIGGGLALSSVETATVSNCIFTGNSAILGGALSSREHSRVELNSSTLYNNSAHEGGAIASLFYGLAIASRCIIRANHSGTAVHCDGFSGAFLTCSDVHGNPGGDWVGCISWQFGLEGNLAQDPLFCNVLVRDFGLHPNSPCAPHNSPAGCGLIGARPVGCRTTTVEPATWGRIKARYQE